MCLMQAASSQGGSIRQCFDFYKTIFEVEDKLVQGIW